MQQDEYVEQRLEQDARNSSASSYLHMAVSEEKNANLLSQDEEEGRQVLMGAFKVRPVVQRKSEVKSGHRNAIEYLRPVC